MIQVPDEGFPCPVCGRPGSITQITRSGREMTIDHPYIGGIGHPTEPCHLDQAATREFIRTWAEKQRAEQEEQHG